MKASVRRENRSSTSRVRLRFEHDRRARIAVTFLQRLQRFLASHGRACVRTMQRRKRMAHPLLDQDRKGAWPAKGVSMARKRLPAQPARDRSRDDESLLLRSAESLGRMIGTLQRQLDIATGRIAATRTNGGAGKPAKRRSSSVNAKAGTKRAKKR